MHGFLDWLVRIDTWLFLQLNGLHAAWLDSPMWYASEKWVWVPVYAILLWVLWKRFSDWRYLGVIVMVTVSIVLNDQLASGVFKDLVARPRPSHTPGIAEVVHLVREPNGQVYKGGTYGFYSSHAANYFGIAALFIGVMRPLRRTWIYLIYAWVLLIAYSRIYLGVHYPGDILMGMAMGSLIGIACSRFFLQILDPWMRRW